VSTPLFSSAHELAKARRPTPNAGCSPKPYTRSASARPAKATLAATLPGRVALRAADQPTPVPASKTAPVDARVKVTRPAAPTVATRSPTESADADADASSGEAGAAGRSARMGASTIAPPGGV